MAVIHPVLLNRPLDILRDIKRYFYYKYYVIYKINDAI